MASLIVRQWNCQTSLHLKQLDKIMYERLVRSIITLQGASQLLLWLFGKCCQLFSLSSPFFLCLTCKMDVFGIGNWLLRLQHPQGVGVWTRSFQFLAYLIVLYVTKGYPIEFASRCILSFDAWSPWSLNMYFILPIWWPATSLFLHVISSLRFSLS